MKQILAVLALSTGLELTKLGYFTATQSIPLQAEPVEAVNSSTWYNCRTREVWTPAKQAWCKKLSAAQNAEYRLPNYETVKLTNGFYENTKQRFTITLVNREEWIDFNRTLEPKGQVHLHVPERQSSLL